MADPQFLNDNERRVLAWCQPGRNTVPVLAEAVVDDPHTAVNEQDEVEEILKDLEARGLASEKGGEWKSTAQGVKAFQNPTAS